MFKRFSSAGSFKHRLRDRLSLHRKTFCRNHLAFGERDSYTFFMLLMSAFSLLIASPYLTTR